jgi:hypothetical protein
MKGVELTASMAAAKAAFCSSSGAVGQNLAVACQHMAKSIFLIAKILQVDGAEGHQGVEMKVSFAVNRIKELRGRCAERGHVFAPQT